MMQVVFSGQLGSRTYTYAGSNYENISAALKSYVSDAMIVLRSDQDVQWHKTDLFLPTSGSCGSLFFSADAIAEMWRGIQLNDDLEESLQKIGV